MRITRDRDTGLSRGFAFVVCSLAWCRRESGLQVCFGRCRFNVTALWQGSRHGSSQKHGGLPYNLHQHDRASGLFPAVLGAKAATVAVTRARSGRAATCTRARSPDAAQDFASVDEARALMEAPGRHALALHGEVLKLEYSIAPQPAAGGGGGGVPGAPMDWVCGMCQAVNFSRRARARRAPGARAVGGRCRRASTNACAAMPRPQLSHGPTLGVARWCPCLRAAGPHGARAAGRACLPDRCARRNGRRMECYQCSTPRPQDPLRITAEPDAPSCVLKVSGLEPHVRCGCAPCTTPQDKSLCTDRASHSTACPCKIVWCMAWLCTLERHRLQPCQPGMPLRLQELCAPLVPAGRRALCDEEAPGSGAAAQACSAVPAWSS